jgi:hypothetical protein
MSRSVRNAVLATVAAVVICGCERNDDPPSPFNQGLGAAGEIVPTAEPRVDMGILQDQRAYKPADVRGLGAGVDAGDAMAQIRQLVDKLLAARQNGDVDAILALFNPEHVEALSESGALFDTFDATKGVEDVASSKLGPEVVDQYRDQRREDIRGNLNIEIHGASSASVTPNLVRDLLGSYATDVMKLGKDGGEWKIQLEAALTEADVAIIDQRLQEIQLQLSNIVPRLQNDEIVNAEQFLDAMRAVMGGAPAAPPTPPSQPAPEPEPEVEPNP